MSGVEGADLVFRLPDPRRELAAVRVWLEQDLPPTDRECTRVGSGWELRTPRPNVHRLEYMFEVTDRTGTEDTRLDPGNPRVADGPFGPHSVIELPGYDPPTWLDVEPVPSRVEPLQVAGTPVGTVEVDVWAPADARPHEPLPLLAVHDGPELARYAALTQYVGAAVATGALPRMRVALLAPGERDAWYSANPDYAQALVAHALPQVHERYTARRGGVLLGASLGAVAALHAEWTYPGTCAGLFLQSGSFFTLATDPQEQEFTHFGEVAAFVGDVLSARSAPSTPAVVLTAGSAEENVHNNRVLAARLSTLDYAVEYDETPDMHNFTAWRDAYDPYLTRLLQRVWGHRRAA